MLFVLPIGGRSYAFVVKTRCLCCEELAFGYVWFCGGPTSSFFMLLLLLDEVGFSFDYFNLL